MMMKRMRHCRWTPALATILGVLVLPTITQAFLQGPVPTGPIADTMCNMEDLEQANDAQLYEILQEIKRTEFVRTFLVDLDYTCPLDEEEFECGGGSAAADHAHDDDDDDDDETTAEPLCTVQGSGSSDAASADPFANPFDSNALRSLKTTGFESKAQQDTFAWKDVTDAVYTEVEEEAEFEVTEDALVPDSFWKDMCSAIGLKSTTATTVNLALNPERNTGYNGTHIWRAIYEENCSVDIDGNHNMACLEERVLYKLLSGLHSSTTLSIAMHYYAPSKRKNRTKWEPNPQFFMERFGDNPEHVRNLHFSYVVMLRALSKAAPFLHSYNISTGNAQEDETATKLLKRLLDSTILQSCSSVFSAFDESLLFQEDVARPEKVNVRALQQNFKGVFHNVSSILDCVQCQQCKLHGKLAMLGYGAALKVLFMKQLPAGSLEQNEIVALINTVVKLSESVRDVRELTALYWSTTTKNDKTTMEPTAPYSVPRPAIGSSSSSSSTTSSASSASSAATASETVSATGTSTSSLLDMVDTAVGLAATLGRQNLISFAAEEEIVQLALQQHPELLILAKHYATDVDKFLLLSANIRTVDRQQELLPDAIVVGSGLAGLAATLNLLDRGGRVILVEKEHLLGGNSNKASSGINACCPSPNAADDDSLELFMNDTVRSAGSSAQQDLITTLVSRSAKAVEFLRSRAGVDLSLTAQLGGHSSKRTHRPSNGMAGAEIIYGMQKAVKAFLKTGELTIMVDTKVSQLLTDSDGSVVGVECFSTKDESLTPVKLHATNVVLATGGFAADRSNGSYMDKYRPELLNMPTTAGLFSQGDGIALATQLGAGTVDMDKVQLHPTGWVDPNDPDNTSKVLAAELMRGVGGILINERGERFCNELGTRSYVTNKMLAHDPGYLKTGNWSVDSEIPSFSLVLSSSAAADGKKHVDLYSHKGLMTRIEGVAALAKWMGLSKVKVVATLKKYQTDAAKKQDEYGKTNFRGVAARDLDKEVFYAGKVTPVLHYCMGGITIDSEGNALSEKGEPILGLHAAGEVSGGVHGVNRLGGNSLLECTVFGTIVGKKLPIQQTSSRRTQSATKQAASVKASTVELRKILSSELLQHSTPEDCWVAIHGLVYDLTEFAEEHPAGAESIHDLAGKDGTEAFSAVHNKGMLEEFDEEILGVYAA